MVRAAERYRSGHNGTDSKSVGGIAPHVGSNPTLSAIINSLEEEPICLTGNRLGDGYTFGTPVSRGDVYLGNVHPERIRKLEGRDPQARLADHCKDLQT